MSERLIEIKAQLLEARKEAEQELKKIDNALDAIGVQREPQQQKPERRARRKRETHAEKRPLSREKLDLIVRILADSDQPLRTSEVAERIDVRKDMVGKAISWLVREGEVRQVGTVPGKGRIGIYAPAQKVNEMASDLRPSERPRPEISKIEDEIPPRVSPSGGSPA